MRKISEMSTDEALDFFCEITPFVNNIVTDEELTAEIKNAIKAESTTTTAELITKGVEKVNKLVPIVFKKRRSDVYGVIAANLHKPIGEIAKQNFLVTAKQVRELIADKDLLDFFKSCAAMEGGE